MTEDPRPEPISDVVIQRVKEVRRGRGWSAAHLAAECAKAGYPQLTKSVIANIETGRRRQGVTVDELFAFAKAFDLPAAALLGWQGADENDAAWQAAYRELQDLTRHMEQAAARLRDAGRIRPPDQEGSQ